MADAVKTWWSRRRRKARVLVGMALAGVRKVRSKFRDEQALDRMLDRSHRRVATDCGLTGKRVLITGSTRGIGFALACAMVEQGASVVVHGRRPAEARETAHQIGRARKNPSASVVGIGVDLTVSGSGATLVEAAIAALGGIDLVINRAGVHDPHLKPVWETSSDEITSMLRVNLVATFEVCAAAVGHMVESGIAGRVINLSTMAAKTEEVSSGGIASYGVSKIALEGLSHFLAAEAGAHGITVATLRPDMIDTDMVAPFFPLDKRLRMLPPDSLVPPVLHVATAPDEEVHGRIFDQLDLLKMLGENG